MALAFWSFTTPSGVRSISAVASWNSPPNPAASTTPPVSFRLPWGCSRRLAGSAWIFTSASRRPSSSENTLSTSGWMRSTRKVFAVTARSAGCEVSSDGVSAAPHRAPAWPLTCIVPSVWSTRTWASSVLPSNDPVAEALLHAMSPTLKSLDDRFAVARASSCRPCSVKSPLRCPRICRSSSTARDCSGNWVSFTSVEAFQGSFTPAALPGPTCASRSVASRSTWAAASSMSFDREVASSSLTSCCPS